MLEGKPGLKVCFKDDVLLDHFLYPGLILGLVKKGHEGTYGLWDLCESRSRTTVLLAYFITFS